MFRLAPNCDKYVGCDFSKVVIEQAWAHTDQLGLKQIELQNRIADDYDGLETASFDVVVLNSIVHQFPSCEYLLKVLRGAVRESLAGRGVKVAIGEKDVGYELRCGRPTAFDRDYTRDLGVGAVNVLAAGGSSVLITRQQGAIVPIPFAEIVDPDTGRARVRQVDITTDSYRSAIALQDRVTAEDLDDPATAKALAAAAGFSVDEARKRYAPL